MTSEDSGLLDLAIRRLVTVTYREPFRIVQRAGEPHVERTTGGLISALEPAMRDMNGLWVSADAHGATERVHDRFADLPYEWQPVHYNPDLHEGFYLGFSNGAMWPLYHGMLGKAEYHRSEWAAYREVNQAFAEVAASHAGDGDLVWVHDYQLSLVPRLLRERGLPADTRIGFFLHIPFPSYDTFRTLPWAKEILLGMLGASLLGFHVSEYAANFYGCVEHILGLRCDRLRGRIPQGDRYVNIRSLPISIDTKQVDTLAHTPPVKARAEALRAEVGCEHLIVGVDRLDYTKGLMERLKALETFFERNPERRGKVSMIQVAVPSRSGLESYQELRYDIERQVGHINGLFAQPGWTPVTFMARSLPFDELVALYRGSDVALVTPLRDGMNLVAKEYVAAQRGEAGVLILSELAGAAEQLTEALLVNPYDVDAVAEAIAMALDLPEETRKRRMRTMYAKVRRYDVAHWVGSFLGEALYVD